MPLCLCWPMQTTTSYHEDIIAMVTFSNDPGCFVKPTHSYARIPPMLVSALYSFVEMLHLNVCLEEGSVRYGGRNGGRAGETGNPG